jgi:hypothetical protein
MRLRLIARAMLAFAFAGMFGCGGGRATTPANGTTQGSSQSLAPAGSKTLIAIQDRAGWGWCSGCAGGAITSSTSMTQHQSTPSLSGSSAQISLGATAPYSNVLWWNELGADSTVAHFTFEFDVLLPDPAGPEALEFDLNQSFDDTRWVFGTQCNFLAGGKWQVWDSAVKHWMNTSVACQQWPANTWTHVVWQFERVGQQVHYISMTVNGNSYAIDMWQAAEPNWPSPGISVDFQLDGNSSAQPYSIYLDNVKVTSW